jgi:arsenate reductase (glutaredoxin)
VIILYGYEKCSSCRDAMKWLDAHGLDYEVRAIRETPPSVPELRAALAGGIRRLFNTSGMDYRELGMKDKLPGMDETTALELLASHGNLVKRPFVIGSGITLVGFKPAEWQLALAGEISAQGRA